MATFADFSLYKKEGYEGNLQAGKILAEHGVPLAFKSVSYYNGRISDYCSNGLLGPCRAQH